MKSEIIYQTLRGQYYWRQNKYVVENCFVLNQWEADFFVVTKSGYGLEFEVKVSRSDFFADKKKELKHLTLSTKKMHGSHQVNENGKLVTKIKEMDIPLAIPNRFSYVTPIDLIKPEEVPEYAGLFYVSEYNQLIVKKQPPYLHREKLNYDRYLCDKFYYYWLKEKREREFAQRGIDNLKNEIKHLKTKIV